LILFIFYVNGRIFQELPPPVRQCDATLSGNLGDACDANLRRCKWFYLCKQNKCVSASIGSSCVVKEDCFGQAEESLRCVNNKCVKPKYPSFQCSDSQECWTGTCINGICSGRPLAAACSPRNMAECDKGLYCSTRTSTCVPQLNTLDFCTDYVWEADIPQGANYNVMCPGGNVCLGPNATQVCRPYKIGTIGTGCNALRDGNDACEFGLFCNPSKGICEVPNLKYPTFGCQGSRNCSFVAGESCLCEDGSTTVGTCRTRTDRVKCDLDGIMNEYRQCMTDFNCAYEKNFLFSFFTDALDGKTCLGKNCANIAKKYMCCALPSYNNVKWSQASSDVLNCGGSSGSNGVVIAFFILFFLCCGVGALIGIGIGIYFFIKNRQKNYSQFE